MIRLLVAISLSVAIAIILAHGVAYFEGQTDSGATFSGDGIAVARELEK
jgi:hypothetical protein